MPVLKIWGRKNSSNVQKTMWAVGELALAYQRFDIGMQFGGNDTPEYRTMNPNGLVPTIQDGEFVLWESNSFIRYLAARYGPGKLEPGDLRSRAVANQWMDWQISTFLPVFTKVFWGLVRTPPEGRDNHAIAEAKAKSIEAAGILDAALIRNAYVAGNSFSMGDIPIGVFMYRFRALVSERPPMPNVDRWYGSLLERPSFREHVAEIPIT